MTFDTNPFADETRSNAAVQSASDDAPRRTSRVSIIVAILFAIPLLGLLVLFVVGGWALTTGRLADTKVVSGNKMQPRILTTVSDSAGLVAGETVIYFYSAAMTPAGDGNLLTDRRVISYVDDGSDAWCDWIAIDEIAAVDFEPSDTWLEDSIIVVKADDGSELTLYASTEGGGDVRFVQAIRDAAQLDEES